MEVADRLRAALAGCYELDRELGRGGMAVVYLAHDVKHDRRVAIKVLRPELAASIAADRFLREIHIAADLQHPLIVPLYDSGETPDGLLWYAMPYVQGETLRERLRREQQLPVDDALKITADAAQALACAHAHGVVHRDIKPENILLSGGHAIVADFGIARALTQAAGATSSGVVVGTPQYMSPEQGAGNRVLDGRSDIYSLGCVLYEMLAGEPPFTGPTPQAVIAKHVSERVPSLQVVRPGLSPRLAEVILKALAKVPADRFSSPAEFAGDLTAAAEKGQAAPRPPWFKAAAVLAVVSVVVVGLSRVWTSHGRDGGVPADTSRYAIFPFEYEHGLDVRLNEVQLLHDALARWSGLSVADPFQVREALSRAANAPVTQAAASRLARELGAGRYVRGTASRVGDSVRVRAGLYDAGANGALLAEYTIRLPQDLRGVDSLFAPQADHLLFRGSLPEGAPALTGTRSFPSRQAFARGQGALETWNLDRADSSFAEATRLDPSYAQAHLWVALIRAWGGLETARWRVPAEQSGLGRDHLSARDQLMSDAIVAEARGDPGRACPIWQRLTLRFPRDFAAWYGWADCLSGDDAVLADQRSPSGWSFRTSYGRALLAYQRAFALHPSVITAFRPGSYARLRNLLFTNGNQRRGGHALPSGNTIFAADPTWQGDSLAFVPYPMPAPLGVRPSGAPNPVDEAVRHERLLFRDIALTWITAAPKSADAMDAFAISLAMLGDASALDTLRRARALARDADTRVRVAAGEVWLEVALALPSNSERLRRARALADSLLATYGPGGAGDPLLLAGLAALTGRAGLAAAYVREPAAAEAWQVPPTLRSWAPALLMYAALGGPTDTLVALERQVRAALGTTVLPGERTGLALQWLVRPATLAFPTYRLEGLRDMAGRGDYLLDLQLAWAAGDTLAVRKGFRDLGEVRSRVRPANRTLDALYPEAALLADLGGPAAAVDWLDPTLASLAQVAPEVLARPVVAASLVHVMALRARLAEQLHDAGGASRWAAAVTILWSDADPFLQPVVRRLRGLVT